MRDIFLRWPMISGLMIMAFIAIITAWPLEAFFFSIVFIIWAAPFLIVVILLLAALYTAIRMALRRQWRSSASALAFPALLLLTPPVCLVSSYTADEIHLAIYRHAYLSAIDATEKSDRGKFAVFDWGGNVMIGFNRFLVFDESDEILSPIADRSEAFRDKLSQHGFIGSDNLPVVWRLGSHFFVVNS